jgi:ubiquinone biosynthesis accessory factor UbiJ
MNSFVASSLLAPFEIALNQVLKQDPHSLNRLVACAGKILEIKSRNSALRLFVHFNLHNVRLGTVEPVHCDARISGSHAELLKLLLSDGQSQALVNTRLSISGDSEFVQAVHTIFQDLDINWQDPLSLVFGDVATHQLDSLFRQFSSWSKKSASALQTNLDEYLHEEARLLPSESEVESLIDSLDALRLRLDRLQARQELMRKQLTLY